MNRLVNKIDKNLIRFVGMTIALGSFCAISMVDAQATALQSPQRWTNPTGQRTRVSDFPRQSQWSRNQGTFVLSRELHEQLSSQLWSPNREQKIAALEYLQQVKPSETLKTQVKMLAEQSHDSIVKGYARLLAADWGVQIDPNPVPVKSSDINPAPAINSFEPAEGSGAQGSSTTGFSHYNTNAPWNFVPANNVHSEYGRPKSLLLTPQSPLWVSNASFDSSLPADAAKIAPRFPEPESEFIKMGDNGLSTAARSSFIQENDEPSNRIRPEILDRSIDAAADLAFEPPIVRSGQGFFSYPRETPLGYMGPSSVLPSEFQQSDHFVPIEDRWRIGFPKWDRYDKGHPSEDDYPYMEGTWLDPYNQNVLKGDFPIIGQHTFYSVTAQSLAVHEYRQTPTATTPFESTVDPFSAPFFGNPDQLFYTPYFRFTFELFHGNEAFKPMDWKFHLTPVFNVNYLDVNELAIVNPDVRRGTNRLRDDFALEEWFVEAKLADIGPNYDFVSARLGSQFFVSDFRGFLFRDSNRAVRLFGTRLANRDQFNAIWFDQAEKDTNSELNTFDDRHQNVLILNYFRQDFVFPGYTAGVSFHYNHDQPSFKFDDNDNLVRPDPVGVFKQHEVNAYYIGLAGEGHIGRVNVVNQIYVALGNDSVNPIGGTEQQINAQMAALELSYDRDWIRFRTSYFFSSGDDDPNDGRGEGFDTILDDPIFAGGEFSYWQRQSIKLFGTNLVQRKSIVPNLRSSKTQGQSNFVNPGLHLFNLGMDFEVTPKARIISNANYLYFDETAVLETYTFQNKINREIGTDLSIGLEYRPLLNDNAIVVLGVATLIPDRGLKDLFGTELPPQLADIGIGNELRNETPRLTSAFLELVLAY